MRRGGCGGNVVPLGQGVGVPDRELLSSRDFSQHTVENLEVEKKKAKKKSLVTCPNEGWEVSSG